MRKFSPWMGYSKRTYRKNRKPISFNQHERYVLVDKRNRCLPDEVFGKPREEQCDCKGCVEARRLQRQYARGINICQILRAPKALADLMDVLLTDDDIYTIVGWIDEAKSQEKTEVEEE